NYALKNNEDFYNTLKKQETKANLNEALNDLTGQKMFSRFADEDLMMMRELTFDMNNKLFMNNDDYLETAGNISTFNFNGNSGSNSRYALINHNYGNYKLGLNYGIADVTSYDADNDNRRKELMFHIGMPISYDKQGFNFITTPHIGYSSGTYDRKGLNSENYDGHIEKTMFGLMNEARYPIAFDKWTIAPSAEFNVVNYATKGYEKGGKNQLNLDLQNNYSVEVGLGLYANTEHKFSEKSKLSFTGGVAMYHEFADPYKLQVGMDGMSGKFDIRDENRSDNRAVIRAGVNFDRDNISLGANVMSYIDKEYRTNATIDFKYNF
ncbi:MAG: autotransporter outer membrane beta-barrel domain-containing protein, partial [Alphaproteobacteria bacterium]|nr:autotransporter outer membrane beta-barrel domain-containing protein [Alphaproteobacteria bacterium]